MGGDIDSKGPECMRRRERPWDTLMSRLVGDYRQHSLEHRLFNAVTLINGLLTLAGSIPASQLPNGKVLAVLHLGVGVLMLGIYLLSRLKGLFHCLFWPFFAGATSFLFVNILHNAGFEGGAHYYLIAGVVVLGIIAHTWRRILTVVICSSVAAAALCYIEVFEPQWIMTWEESGLTEEDAMYARISDQLGNFVFVQVLVGLMILILTRSLQAERKRSDELLLNILPETIAHELKAYERVEPKLYDSVTLFFSDMVGFTRMASSVDPEDLVHDLDLFFKEFDQISTRHGIEKIKTIGDAYMAAGGVPIANKTHAFDVVLAALEMLDCLPEINRKKRIEVEWNIRVGIHTGCVSAGVTGAHKFAYDLWGDTVNVASRMESNGVPGEINVSRETRDLIADCFEFEERGMVPVKNRGEVEMFLVKRLKPEFSADAAGRKPNAAFEAKYKALG